MTSSQGETALATRVRDLGFTPGIRDLAGLFALFSDEDEDLAKATERAILRIEARHTPRLVSETIAELATAKRPARGRLVRLLGRAAAAAPATAELAVAEARAWLVGALVDADPKTRHGSARALGKLRPSDVAERERLERALLAAWDAGADDDRRALADALGKVGSAAARERLAAAARGTHPGREGNEASHGLAQRATRAALILDRSASRNLPGIIDLTRAPERPTAVRFHARAGLEEIVVGELGDAWRPRVAAPGLVDARLTGTLASAAATRTALHVGFPLDPIPMRGELAETIVRPITDARAMAILRRFTRTEGGPIRFRLAWARGGHRRALAWKCAALIATATKELVNDPTESTWEIVVDDDRDRVALELVPRGFVDERFAYRGATVPASSHPTIAAALARLVTPRVDDVVWDPFVGAGAELVERARLGPYASLTGTDVDAEAIDAAKANLSSAGIRSATLAVADATSYVASGVSLIITNPPMGRRVQRGTHSDVLERFVAHAARLLVPGGALVWAAPDARANAHAERAGLVIERAFSVDMGGFPAEFSVHRKPARHV